MTNTDNPDHTEINDNNNIHINNENIEEEDDYSNKEIAKKLLGSSANILMYFFFGMLSLIFISIGYGLYLGFFAGNTSYLDFNIIKALF